MLSGGSAARAAGRARRRRRRALPGRARASASARRSGSSSSCARRSAPRRRATRSSSSRGDDPRLLARDGLVGLGFAPAEAEALLDGAPGETRRGAASRQRAAGGAPMTHPHAGRRPHPDARTCRAEDELDARCARGGSPTSSARRGSRSSSASRSRPPPPAARRSTTCCSPGPPGLGKTSLAQIVAAELGVAVRADRRPGARAQGRHRRVPDALEPRAVFFVDEIHRLPRAVEETFYPAMEDRQLPITVGQGAGRPRRDARPAAVHARRRDDPRRPAHHAAARPLRHPAPPRALRAGGARAHRRPLAPACSAWRSTRRARGRSPTAPAARRASPTGCSSACATTREVRGDGAIDVDGGRRGARPARGRRTSAWTAWTASCSRRSASSFGGGPVGLSTLAVAVGEEADTIEDVYEPYLLQRGFLQRTPRGRVRHARTPSGTSGCRRRREQPRAVLTR